MLNTVRKSAVWNNYSDLRLLDLEMPALKDGDLLVKVYSCAICGSDLRIYKHGNPRVKSGTIIGHEIAGEVVEVRGQNDKFKVGDRVAIGADVPCGNCIHCHNGQSNCCDVNFAIGHQFEGGFTEYMHINNLTASLGPISHIQSRISFDAAALAEPLACCINGFERGLMSKGHTVVIFGAGPIGLMLATLAKIYEAKQVILIEPLLQRRNRAIQLGYGDQVLDPNQVDVVNVVMELTHGLGADLIFTACPVVETHDLAIKMLAKRGVVNFFGGLPKDARAISLLSNFIHYREAYLTGSHGSTPVQHQKALQLIEGEILNVNDLITHRFPLSQIHKAYDMAASGDAIKVIIKPQDYV